MPASRPSRARRRPRRGSLERPVNARLYRGTWLLVALPLLLAAFSIARPVALPRPVLPPAFDAAAARALTLELAKTYPDRSPGSTRSRAAAAWVGAQLARYALPTQTDTFDETIPGEGRVTLRNVVALVRGRSPATIVVSAHRDDAGSAPGANDNASGTGALLELARVYAAPSPGEVPLAQRAPEHTIAFLSTDGGAFGALGARHFATDRPDRRRVVAVVNLDAIAGTGRPRIELAGDAPRSPPATLVQTTLQRLLEQTGAPPARPSALAQLIDLAFPLSLYEQAPFVGRGIPAITLTSAGSRPPASFGDVPARLDNARLAAIGTATQQLVGSLDQGLELAQGTTSYLFLGGRIVRGWAIEVVLISMLLPFVVAVVDLFARCRRRGILLAPALRSFRSRLFYWLFGAVLFAGFAWAGAFPQGAAAPLNPETAAADDWPLFSIVAFVGAALLAWFVARDRLIPRRPIRHEEELAGYAGALVALAVVALLVAATNPFALVFVLPSVHAWLWLAQVQRRPPWLRACVLLLGFAGPVLLLWSLASRFGLGLDAPWYLAELVAVGYVPWASVLITAAWAACAAQLAALALARYAPYPARHERRARGPVREVVRRSAIAIRSRRLLADDRRRAAGG